MKIPKNLFLYLLFFLFFPKIFAVKYGSESAVSVQSYVTFPSSDSDNEMLAFGWFKNGFELQDQTTSCTFSSAFPVSGLVSLCGGDLYLNSDLHLENVTTLSTLGRIYGSNHIISMDSSVESLIDTVYPISLYDTDLIVNADLTISTTINFFGNCYVNGKSKRLYLDPTSQIVVGHNSTLYLKNLEIEGICGYNFRCLDNTGKILLDNVAIYMDGNYNFTSGQLEIWNDVDFSGSYTFYYDCLQTLTIDRNSFLRVCDGASVGFGVNCALNKERVVYFYDNSSKLWFDNSNVCIGSSGVHITRGAIVMSGRVNFDIRSTTPEDGLIMGDGTSDGDIAAEFYPASYVIFNNGHVSYNESDPHKFLSKSTYSKLIRGASNTFRVMKDQVFGNVTIKADNGSALIVDPGVKLTYEDCRIVMPSVKFSITAGRYNTYTTLLDGDNEIFLEDGILPFYLFVKNTNNVVGGSGNLSGVTTLYNSDSELTFNMDGYILNNIILNGGTINLSKNLEFAYDKTFVGSGNVNLSNNDLTLGSMDISWTSSIYWDASGGKFDLNSKVSLSGTWTFSGNCTIAGNNNILVMNPSGRIYVERGSVLTFKNIKIYGMEGINISCIDDSSKIIFSDSCCKLTGDYFFEKGSFDIDYMFEVHGTNRTFYYESKLPSVIKHCSTLVFNPSVTLSYSPISDQSNLIQLQTIDSVLHLKDANLHSTPTGLHLTIGRLFIEGKCCILSEATCKNEGIVFGDGISTQNDLTIRILDASCLEIVSGCVITKNIN